MEVIGVAHGHLEHQRHYKCVTIFLGIRSLRIVGDSGIGEIG
ncbi:unnamed protein product [Spodoptera littoralis]|uniref:Uncharacterized protein n=1 Tax=Spodoptera littoralis TaxID=7109 RepID=A0A9P0MYL4_SPOLI|nr:unnamed protein product [Spodoptera littoralis]CAH1634834.1 unnamed protein product [Spodoptera littoralis]